MAIAGTPASASADATSSSLTKLVAPAATAPAAIDPEANAPDATAPEAIAPEATAPEAIAPEATAPDAMPPEATVTAWDATVSVTPLGSTQSRPADPWSIS